MTLVSSHYLDDSLLAGSTSASSYIDENILAGSASISSYMDENTCLNSSLDSSLIGRGLSITNAKKAEQEDFPTSELEQNITTLPTLLRAEEIRQISTNISQLQQEILSGHIHSSKDVPRGIYLDTDSNSAYIHLKEKNGEKKLGFGYFKITYKAIQINLLSSRAFLTTHQKIDPSEKNNCIALSEANMQQTFHHPHIVQLYNATSYQSLKGLEKVAMYTELCNHSMKDALICSVLLTPEKKLQVLIDTTDALDYLHENGFSHNDIKPDNIMVKDKRGKLTDFGLTRKIGQTIPMLCTRIKAPEQTSQWSDAQTDVYQFGLTLFQVMHPYLNAQYLDESILFPSVEEMLKSWLISSEKDAILHELIRNCLQTNPSLRPTMSQIEQILIALQG